MADYIDGFLFPIDKKYLEEYAQIAQTVAEIWKEHGAIAYFEYIGDDLFIEGTQSFVDALNTNENEAIIFGWVAFDSKEKRNLVFDRVSKDPRMEDLVAPLIDPTRMIFNPKRMSYGGFKSFI